MNASERKELRKYIDSIIANRRNEINSEEYKWRREAREEKEKNVPADIKKYNEEWDEYTKQIEFIDTKRAELNLKILKKNRSDKWIGRSGYGGKIEWSIPETYETRPSTIAKLKELDNFAEQFTLEAFFDVDASDLISRLRAAIA